MAGPFDPRALVEQLRRRLPDSPPRTVGGVCPGARAVAIAALARDGCTVVVVPAARDAEDLAHGLALIAPDMPACALPVEAIDPGIGRRAPLGATAAASLALARLAAGDLRVLIVPARILPFAVPPPAALTRRAPRVAVGEVVDPHSLVAALVEAGYRRVEIVEEAGDVAVRGEIVDVGTPDRFVRIGLDIDRVEHIAEFDPDSQRSGAALPEVVLPPLSLFAASEEVRASLAARLETAGCAALAAAVLDGRAPESWEALLGWVQPAVAAWQLGSALVVCERAAVAAEIDRTLQAARRAVETLAREGTTLPPPDEWLRSADDCAVILGAADVVDELAIEDGTPWVRVATAPTANLASRPQALIDELKGNAWSGKVQGVVAATAGELQRLQHLFAEAELPVRHGWAPPGVIGLVAGELTRGFTWGNDVVIFGRSDVTTMPAPARQRRTLGRVLAEMRDLTPGDWVVHIDHGIGRFLGFRSFAFEGEAHDCVELEYSGGGKLLVPLERADCLEKYAGADSTAPHLDRLGGSSWARTTSRVKKALKDMAEDLLKVQAKREVSEGFAFSKDSPWQREFEDAFEWELTADQTLAVAEMKRDMESPRPADRLLVGDVGYGKTEVAMRAAFKAVMDGKQVAVLAPTTILAEQHLRTMVRRFEGFPVEIRGLSRFSPPAEQKQVAQGFAAGTVDVVIGTHRLLAADIKGRDLGLVIVDEEQRFGVAQKEKLKNLTASVDVLAMSATPIPRTLNLGLMGLRDVSIIETPPRDRLAVQTHVLPFGREILREAILTELARGGQVFFVHNRVASIGAIAELVREVVPEARTVIAHGQMEERTLARAMNEFVEARADVLIATSIIENGLDIANANTLIVNRADRFGLAQLHQLRGRVGRSDRLAFAYLLVPPETSLSEEARQRLAAIVEFADLGAGFRIAARDLEIRGAGNLLGSEQHGHLRAVGYETYCHLLEEAVRELQGSAAPPPPPDTELHLGLDLRLPAGWIAEETLRLAVYRRIAAAQTGEEFAALRAEFVDRFGPAPLQLDNLLLHQALRRRAEALALTRVKRTSLAWELVFDPTHPAAHDAAMALLGRVVGATLAPTGAMRLPAAGRDPAAAANALLALLGG